MLTEGLCRSWVRCPRVKSYSCEILSSWCEFSGTPRATGRPVTRDTDTCILGHAGPCPTLYDIRGLAPLSRRIEDPRGRSRRARCRRGRRRRRTDRGRRRGSLGVAWTSPASAEKTPGGVGPSRTRGGQGCARRARMLSGTMATPGGGASRRLYCVRGSPHTSMVVCWYRQPEPPSSSGVSMKILNIPCTPYPKLLYCTDPINGYPEGF